MSMKSSSSKLWDLSEGKTVQSWKPDEIFPSLTSDELDPVMVEMLQLFQPQSTAEQGDEQHSKGKEIRQGQKSPEVRNWNLSELENIPESDFGSSGSYTGIEGTPVRIAQDEKHRLAAEARKQAEEILLNAKKTAREIIQEAQQEAGQIREEAHAAGRAQAVAELQKATQNSQLILDQMTNWRRETVQKYEPLVIDMVQKIARLMFGEGIMLNNEALQQNLNKVMKMAESLGDIRIYMNPHDVFNIDPEWKRFQEGLSGKRIQLIPSDTILPGGCYVQGEMGVVDARVETQLGAVLTALNPDPEKETTA